MNPHPTEVPGVWVEAGFVPDADAAFAALRDGTGWDARMRARRTASFGVPYNYSGITYPPAPLPEPVAALNDRLADRLGWRPNNCLANYYADGNSTMGFHADATDDLDPGTGVAVVSLGAERAITFRSAADRAVTVEYPLTGGSLLYMTAEVQAGWKHAILPRPGAGGRISLTFRRMKADWPPVSQNFPISQDAPPVENAAAGMALGTTEPHTHACACLRKRRSCCKVRARLLQLMCAEGQDFLKRAPPRRNRPDASATSRRTGSGVLRFGS